MFIVEIIIHADSPQTALESNDANSARQASSSTIQQPKKLPKILNGGYFTVTSINGDNVAAMCQTCKKSVLGSIKSTGNFRSHLKMHHWEVFNKMEKSEGDSVNFKIPKQTIIGFGTPSKDDVNSFHYISRLLTF